MITEVYPFFSFETPVYVISDIVPGSRSTLFDAPKLLRHDRPTSNRLHHMESIVIDTVVAICSFLIRKIMACVKLILQLRRPEKETVSVKKFAIEDLFNLEIDYPSFRDKVLTCKKQSRLLYNNYNFESISSFKIDLIDKIKLLVDCRENQEQKDLAAGIATYEAIVDLWVGRFFLRHPAMDREPYRSSLRFTALCIAIKVSFDQAIWNSDFKAFFHPDLIQVSERHNRMESEFLNAVEWNLSTKELLDESILPDDSCED